MSQQYVRWPGRIVGLLCLCGVVLGAGCGWIADKDRIKVAKLREEYITRGDLYRVLWEMPDDERPHIQTKGDFVRALKSYVYNEIKKTLGAELVEQGIRLVTREQAMQRFFAQHAEENYQLLFTIDDPQVLGMTRAEWDAAKAEAELAIDRIEQQMLGDAALAHHAINAFKEGRLTVADDEYQREYDLRKDELKTRERVRFLAIRFKTGEPGAEAGAADVRRRLDSGEGFDALVDEFLLKDKGYILDSDIENNPKSSKFTGFWMHTSGCQPGDIIGPVFLPAYELTRRAEDGRLVAMTMPNAYLVFKVLEHAPERTLTLEEAKPALASPLFIAKMMQRLRDENGLEIYYEKLPDPSMYAQRGGDPIMGQN